MQLQIVEDPLLAAATNVFRDSRTYSDRKPALEAFGLAHESKMRRTEVLKRVMDAASAMKKANGELVQVIENTEWSAQDIQDFAQKAQSLQTAVQIFVTQ
jgi:hypothetical protein